ncbi:MAG: biotin-dependent carboxyltransferase family protein [Pseudomonadota bacterium]
MSVLEVVSVAPGVTVQDQGRPGYLARGLSRSGAADRLALAEGAALVGNAPDAAAIEMNGIGGAFTAQGSPILIALTGAPMRADLGGAPLAWNTSHTVAPGQTLTIGAATAGTYGYLHVAGGIATDPFLGARSTHMVAGIGGPLSPGQSLPLGAPSRRTEPGMTLSVENRFQGGVIRVVRSLQTDHFAQAEVGRFANTDFTRDARANRMGVRLTQAGPGFAAEGGLNVLSEVIVSGDIQITGDGTPFVLLPESQTTGGYPRLATVIPADLPRIAQAPPGAAVRFSFVTLDEAVAAERAYRAALAALPGQIHPRLRDPRDIPDLLSYQLIGGVTAGDPDMEGMFP